MSLPADCLFLIIEYLTDYRNYIAFSLISTIHLAVADSRRTYLRNSGPRSLYLKTFNPESLAASKAQLIKEINIYYLSSTSLLLHGSKIENAINYSELPLESKIPGIADITTLIVTLRKAVEQITGCELKRRDNVKIPSFRLSHVMSNGQMTGKYSVVFMFIPWTRSPNALFKEQQFGSTIDLKYRKTFSWETLSSDISVIRNPKTNKLTIKKILHDYTDNSIDPGDIYLD